MDKKKKSKKQRVGKVNPILYAIVYAVLKQKYKKYNISFDNEIAKSIKGPAIVVATHTCDQDHILSALTLHPVRPTYIVSEHFMRIKSTARLLRLMHVITKKMFTPDVSTIRNVLRAKGEGAVIVIFPEGRLSCYGKTLPVAEGTAELIKKLGVNLYAWKAEGAYLTFPKWRNKGDNRIGKIDASVKLLLSAEEIAEKSVDQIKAITAEAIYNDDEKAMAGIEYKCENIAAGVDKVLFKCPKCQREGAITSEGNHIRCECGLDATLDNYYKLHDAPFESINEWFEWQQNSIDVENESIFAKARLGTPGEDGYMDPYAGEGEVYIDKDTFSLKGTLHGEAVDFSISPEKIGAFPISPGDHIDVYVHGKLVYIYPEPDLRSSVKWVCFLDKLCAQRNELHTH
ncbi:MAG: 1-acyl-sn-glycerol-3-phosphate acyltransferase [Clostridia bacterium]|nr:1-acyl-sn-glycerol-3-phosphate acyltransferase [Clostridia bacterium]